MLAAPAPVPAGTACPCPQALARGFCTANSSRGQRLGAKGSSRRAPTASSGRATPPSPSSPIYFPNFYFFASILIFSLLINTFIIFLTSLPGSPAAAERPAHPPHPLASGPAALPSPRFPWPGPGPVWPGSARTWPGSARPGPAAPPAASLPAPSPAAPCRAALTQPLIGGRDCGSGSGQPPRNPAPGTPHPAPRSHSPTAPRGRRVPARRVASLRARRRDLGVGLPARLMVDRLFACPGCTFTLLTWLLTAPPAPQEQPTTPHGAGWVPCPRGESGMVPWCRGVTASWHHGACAWLACMAGRMFPAKRCSQGDPTGGFQLPQGATVAPWNTL